MNNSRSKVIVRIIGIVILIGGAIAYLAIETTTYSLTPKSVRAGDTVTITFSHFGQKDYPECLSQGVVEDVKTADGESVLIKIGGIGDAVTHAIKGKTGFIDPSTYDQLQKGETFIIESFGWCLPGAEPTPFVDRFIKKTTRGEVQRLMVLPGTPAGTYSILLEQKTLLVTVQN